MAHKWKKIPAQNARVCTVCGVQQTWRYKHEWGVNKGRYWSPKAGRCKPKKCPTSSQE